MDNASLVLPVLMNLAILIDFGQTMHIAKNPDRFFEYNPILGRHPSKKAVKKYFLGAAILANTLYFALPHPYDKWYAAGVIILEVGCIGKNYSSGVKITW
jgi:hypothetical protein